MRLRTTLAAVGLVGALAAGSAGAAPFTPHFAGLQAAIVARAAALQDQFDPVSRAQFAACGKAIAAMAGDSGSVATDLKFAVKVAKALEKAFPFDDPLLADLSATLDGLEGEYEDARSILVLEISLLSGSKAAAAAKGLGAADVLLARADFAPTRAARAKFLGKAAKKVAATRRALRGGGTPGFQGPRNASFEEDDPFAVFPDPDGVLIRNAAFSIVGYLADWATAGGTIARTGIGAPHGVAKGGVGASFVNGGGGYQPGSLFQTGVNLSRSRRLRFEWELSGTIGDPCTTTGEYGFARVEIRFSTDSGTTVTLWRLDLHPNPSNGALLAGLTSAVVDLPYLPEPGTLTFFAERAQNPCPPPPPTPPGSNPTPGASNWNYLMYLDNIRVE